MISAALLERLACPVCLEDSGCAACARAMATHAHCEVEYAARVRCGCGGPDKRRLERTALGLVCPCCSHTYALRDGEGYVDLLPPRALGELTQYADHEFHERLGVTDAPPLLSARVKADMMGSMLDPAPGEHILDLGCGAGKFVLFAGRDGAGTTGVDVAPFFLSRARAEVDLVLADLRRLPFRNASFPCAYSLDVLEHLDEIGVREVLLEARRTLDGSGRLFVYTHAMESSRIAAFQRSVNRLARRLGERGLIDHEREALRKSDHVNAIRSHEHFDALAADAGLVVVERRYYNVVFKAVVEDLGLRLFEQWRRRRSKGRAAVGSGSGGDRGGASAPAGPSVALAGPASPGTFVTAVATVLTWLLKLDVVFFGSVRTGPFFGLLRKRAATHGSAP